MNSIKKNYIYQLKIWNTKYLKLLKYNQNLQQHAFVPSLNEPTAKIA